MVSDLLGYSEPSSRVFLFDNILLLVVPTTAICSSKGMIPTENIKRNMTTLGNITNNHVSFLPFRSLEKTHEAVTLRAIFHPAMHKYHIHFCLCSVNIVILCTSPCCAFRICIMHGFRLDPLSLANQRRVRATFLNTYVVHYVLDKWRQIS